jgi:uncharacterized repeat protein (TIGR03806 family)
MRALALILIALCLVSGNAARAERPADCGPQAIDARSLPRAYLRMPPLATGKMPALLSETGAFSDTAKLVPSAGLVPYDLAVAFWSDGAQKSRWISLPDGKIGFSPTGEWRFPAGTVFVKTFELPVDAGNPAVSRRLETRLLVRDSNGGVYGVVYKWRPDNSDADLLDAEQTELIPARSATGEIGEQPWYYPSRKDCQACHNQKAGGVLGVNTRQLNRTFVYPSGISDNELRAWNNIGLFEPGFNDEDIPGFARLASADDTTRSLEDRARSYLDANCAQCHRPGGTVVDFDARYETPLQRQGLVNGPVLIDEGIDRARIISPRDVWRSIAFMRMNTAGSIKMPPLARETIDQEGVALLRQWIVNMPGTAVLDPPVISPAGGNFDQPVEFLLTGADAGADIRYTLDGTAPGESDMRYEKPIKLSGPTIVRARAFKDGYTRSIVSQQVFIIEK